MKHTHHNRSHSIRRGAIRINPTVWVALLLMSVAGVVATYLYHFRNPDPSASIGATLSDQPTDTPKEKANYTPDITNIIEQCKKMASIENSFVIFEHGTCVRLLEPVADHTEAAYIIT